MSVLEKINAYADLIKLSYIRRIGNKWRVFSEKGKNLGTYDTKEEAEKRLKQIHYFKSKKASKEEIDLSDIDDLSYSAIIRKLRKENPEVLQEFQAIFKQSFDTLFCKNEENVADKALKITIELFSNKYSLKLNIKKQADANPQLVGKYLADIIKFVLSRISEKNRPKSIYSLKNKLMQLNILEMANKKMPASSAIGQSITFVKSVLFNKQPEYIRQVINNTVRFL